MKDTLKAKFLRKWIKALRSGEYIQTVGHFCRTNFDGQLCHCPLGVALELIGAKRSIASEWDGKGVYKYKLDGFTNPLRALSLSIRDCSMIINKNDMDQISFKEMADYIEDKILPKYNLL